MSPQTGYRRWWTLAVLSLSLIVISLDNTVLNVALPSLRSDLGASGTDLQWIVDAVDPHARVPARGARQGDPGQARLDPVGAGPSTAALSTLLYSVIDAPQRGWGDPLILAVIAAAAALGAGFVWWERRTPQPMIDLTLLRNPRFAGASGPIALLFFALFGFLFLVTQYMQSVLGLRGPRQRDRAAQGRHRHGDGARDGFRHGVRWPPTTRAWARRSTTRHASSAARSASRCSDRSWPVLP